jgi:hypothetical protein
MNDLRDPVRFGGKSPLKLFVKGGDDVRDAILASSDGGGKATVGLRELVRERYNGAFDLVVTYEPADHCTVLLHELRKEAGGRFAGLAEEPGVVVLGVSSDLETGADEFSRTMPEVVRILKHDIGAHVLVQNCSSIDHDDSTINYHGIPHTLAERIHRLNLRVIELSILEGISVIDADRIVAEFGGAAHVAAPLDYSDAVCDALCSEYLRVLEDYCFFEERRLIPQLGRSEAVA